MQDCTYSMVDGSKINKLSAAATRQQVRFSRMSLFMTQLTWLLVNSNGIGEADEVQD